LREMSDSTSMTFLAIGQAILTSVVVSTIYASPLIASTAPFAPWTILPLVALFSFLFAILFLYLGQVPKQIDEKSSAGTIFYNSTTPVLSAMLLVSLAYFFSYFRSFITAAVPAVYTYTPEQLIIFSKEMEKGELDGLVHAADQKQTILDDTVAYGYFTFWGNLFGMMMALAFS